MIRMYTSKSILRFLVYSFLFSLISYGCMENLNSNAKQPKKPPNVPKEAVWSGGVDGGVFIYIRKEENSPPNIYVAKIFYDSTGDIWYEGRLSVEPPEDPIFDYKSDKVFSGWDGDTLYLRDGRKLTAIDPVE